MSKDTSTEEKIKLAARTVFLTKGFEGCTSREIAKAAGMNVALVNYYFRSKSQLFSLIFKAAMEDFFLSMVSVFRTDQSLEDKMKIFIEKEYEFLIKHPELPNFIFTELNREDGCSLDHKELFAKFAETGIFDDCVKAQQNGSMREISLTSIILLVLSNCQYPIMAKNLMQSIHNLDDTEYKKALKIHQGVVTEMMLNYLFPKNQIAHK